MVGLSRSEASASSADHHVACDLLDAHRTDEVIRALQPDIVIHAQALSDVDRCEQDPVAANAQNADAIANVVRAVEHSRALVVYVSTDYVFDGTKGAPYDEADTPHPINVYGRSKLNGERIVLEYPRGIVVRTSTLFGEGRMTFCDAIVTRLRAQQPVEAFLDQVTSPTYTEDLAQGLADLSLTLVRSRELQGPRTFHVANAGGCSRVELAHRVAELLGQSRDLIRPVPMASQRRVAARPAYSAFTTRHLSRIIGRTLRPWDDALHAYLRQRHWLN